MRRYDVDGRPSERAAKAPKCTVLEMVCEGHHGHGHGASVGTVEHPFRRLLGVKRHLPKSLEGERVEEDQAGLVGQRSRRQEVGDGALEGREGGTNQQPLVACK